MSLKNYPLAELQKEIAKRMADAHPAPKANPDWSKVLYVAEMYLKDIQKDGYADEDSKQYIFEEVMSAVFGQEVWQWINDRT